MKKIVICIFSILLFIGGLSAQLTVEKFNYLLDTQPYFGFRLDYSSNLTLSDSVKQKFLTALSGELTPHLQDSLLSLPTSEKERLFELSRERCKGDSLCIEQAFQEIIADIMGRNNHFFTTQPISSHLILAAGSWNIREAIPILENAVGNERYGQQSILMALAKLGNDSIKQALIERYTLSYILQTTELNTINDNHFYGGSNLTTRLFSEGMQVAMYLKNKDIMFNLLDLIYIRGRNQETDFGTYPTVVWLLSNLSMFHFQNYPNIEVLWEISDAYILAIEDLERKRRNRREQAELDRLLSTERRTKVKNQIQDWIIENVNFK